MNENDIDNFVLSNKDRVFLVCSFLRFYAVLALLSTNHIMTAKHQKKFSYREIKRNAVALYSIFSSLEP